MRPLRLGHGVAKEAANTLVDPSAKATTHRKAYAIYAERFAHFFRRDYMVPRMFHVLNSESKPAHAGFRRSCDTPRTRRSLTT